MPEQITEESDPGFYDYEPLPLRKPPEHKPPNEDLDIEDDEVEFPPTDPEPVINIIWNKGPGVDDPEPTPGGEKVPA